MIQDGGSKRRQAAEQAIASTGGKLEGLYFAFGKHDVYALIEAPDNAAVDAAALAIQASGAATTQTAVLLTLAEIDHAAKQRVAYHPPGH